VRRYWEAFVNGRAVALGLCVLATVVGCSTEVGGDNLSAPDLCKMMPAQDVGDQLGISLTRSQPRDYSRKIVTIVTCQHEGKGEELNEYGDSVPLIVWVTVEVRQGESAAADEVKRKFADAGGTVGFYQEVADLGDAAGFGPTPDVRNQYRLTVATEHSDAHREVTVDVDIGKEPTLDQMRQIAEDMLQKLDD
jgi:hypothetical protein